MHVCHCTKCTNAINSVMDSPCPCLANQIITPMNISVVETIVKEFQYITSGWNNNLYGYQAWISTPYHPWSSAVQLTAELKDQHVYTYKELMRHLEADRRIVTDLQLKSSYEELSLDMNPGFSTMKWKPKNQTKNGVIPPHQNWKCLHTTISCKVIPIGIMRGNFTTLHIQERNSHQYYTCISYQ